MNRQNVSSPYNGILFGNNEMLGLKMRTTVTGQQLIKKKKKRKENGMKY